MCTKTSPSFIEFKWKPKRFFNDTFLMNSPSIKGMWICPLKNFVGQFHHAWTLISEECISQGGSIWVSIIVLPFQRKMNVLKEQLSFWASTIFGSLNTNIVMPINIYTYTYIELIRGLYNTITRPSLRYIFE